MPKSTHRKKHELKDEGERKQERMNLFEFSATASFFLGHPFYWLTSFPLDFSFSVCLVNLFFEMIRMADE